MKASKTASLLVAGLLLLTTGTLQAQLSGNSISEYQLGNIPDTDPDDLSSFYNQINLRYRNKGLKASARIEQFYTNDSINRDYQQLSQWQLNYSHKKIEVVAGNYFETLGRGLLLRSFEIPASIKEERFYRVRHGFYRDMQGAAFKYKGDIFRVKALYGKPLQNTFPPGSEFQRTETLEAVQPELYLKKQRLGTALMRLSELGVTTLYTSTYLQGILPANFSYYGEVARDITDNYDVTDFSREASYGAYLTLSHSYGSYGVSVEYKSYQNFLIGSGISDPPTLVKEHSYRLLNRSTHLPELRNEQGYQVDMYYTFADNKMLSFNHSWAENVMQETFQFQEWFLEYYWPLSQGGSLKAFVDFSSDEIIREDLRYAGGLYYTYLLANNWSLSFESEAQHIDRNFLTTQSVTNAYLGLIVSKGTHLSVSAYYEFTDDPAIADRVSTTEQERSRHFYGLGFGYRPNKHHALNAFVGERRGGPACTSGVCYQVLDFRGVELRWTAKFN